MSLEAMELLIVILTGILVLGATYEIGKMILRHVEANRERWRREAWSKKRGGDYFDR